MIKRVLLTLGIFLVVLIGLILFSRRSTGQRAAKSYGTKPFTYGQEDVTSFLKKRGINVEVVQSVRRNASGTELFVFLFDSPSNHSSVIKITTNSLIWLKSPGPNFFPTADDGCMAWYADDTDTVHFQNGETLDLPRFSFFDVDPSGKYFVVGEKPNRTWLGRVQSPQAKVVIGTNLLAEDVFVSGDKIYVSGIGYKSNPSEDLATCLVLKEEGKTFQLIDTLSFDWASGIVDVDPAGARLLLWDRALISHAVYSYDLTTKKRQRVGTVQGFEFFLTTDLLK